MIEQLTIKRMSDGETRTLAAWGIEKASLRLALLGATNAGDDQFSGEIVLRVDDAAPFAPFERCEVFNAAGARIFVGWARYARARVSAGEERQQIVLDSPSRYLRSVYLAAANTYDGASYTEILSASVVLNQALDSDEEGHPISTKLSVRQQLDAILSFAKDTGNAGGAAPFDYALDGVPSDSSVVAPETGALNSTCLACIEKALALMPSLAMRWDYSGGAGTAPVLRFVKCITLDEDTGELLAEPEVSGGGSPAVHSLPLDGTLIAEMEPQPRDDLLVGTLNVIFSYDSGEWEEGLRRRAATVQTSTVANGSPLAMVMQISLRTAMWSPEADAFVNPEAVPSFNWARALHQGPRSRVFWQLALRTGPSENLRWTWRPGDLANVTDAGGDLAEAFTQMQVITRSFETGDVRLETGAPSQRGTAPRGGFRRSGGGSASDPQPSTQENTFGTKQPDTSTTPVARPGADGAPAVIVDVLLEADGGAVRATVAGPGEGNSYAFTLWNIVPVVDSVTLAFSPVPSAEWVALGNNHFRLDIYLPDPGAVSLTIGTVTTLAAGEDATASITGTAPDFVLDLGIPRGADADCGDYATTEAMEAAIAAALATLPALYAANVDAIAPLGLTASNPPTQAEVQSIADKVDELIGALHS
jgi:hypothetical protein